MKFILSIALVACLVCLNAFTLLGRSSTLSIAARAARRSPSLIAARRLCHTPAGQPNSKTEIDPNADVNSQLAKLNEKIAKLETELQEAKATPIQQSNKPFFLWVLILFAILWAYPELTRHSDLYYEWKKQELNAFKTSGAGNVTIRLTGSNDKQ